MDIEQLKLILSTMQTLGEVGKEAFLWWLLAEKVLPVLGWLVFFTFLYLLLRNLIVYFRATKDLEDLRDMLGIGTPGFLTSNEHRRTMKALNDLIAEKRGRA